MQNRTCTESYRRFTETEFEKEHKCVLIFFQIYSVFMNLFIRFSKRIYGYFSIKYYIKVYSRMICSQ